MIYGSFNQVSSMTRRISINEMTLHLCEVQGAGTIPFRVRIEIAGLLSKLGVSVIETAPIRNGKSDYFLVKSLASTVTGSTLSVPLDILDPNSPAVTWDALKEASHPRLSVPVPVSTVQMEYLCHMKPDGILDLIRKRVAGCASLCGEVEFVALDFTRSDPEFLLESINAAIEAGADEVRVESTGNYTTSLKRFARILNTKSETCGAQCGVGLTALDHICSRIHELCEGSLRQNL